MMFYDILRYLNSNLPGKADFGELSRVDGSAGSQNAKPQARCQRIIDVPEGNGWRLYRPGVPGARVNSETT